MLKRLLLVVGVLLALLTVVLFVRASALDGVRVETLETAVPTINAERAAASLSTAITYRTISRQGVRATSRAAACRFANWSQNTRSLFARLFRPAV